MCIILLAESKHLTKDILKKAENMNNDGAGIAWIDQKTKEVKWIKGKNIKTKTILKIIKSEKIQFPYIVHFRITSIGKTNNKLCHPFDLNADLDQNKISGSSKAGVLFHNGTLRDYKIHMLLGLRNEKIKGDLSDSRVMAYLVKRIGRNYLERCLNGQKIAILTPNGIEKYGNFQKIEDIQMSNGFGMNSYNSCENDFYSETSWYNSPYLVSNNQCENDNSKKHKMKKQNKKSGYFKVNALNTKSREISKNEKITSYNGHGKFCNCIPCNKIKTKIEIELDNKKRNEVKVNALSIKNDFFNEKQLELKDLNDQLMNRSKEKDLQLKQNQDNEIYYYAKLDQDMIHDILNGFEKLNHTTFDILYDYLSSITLEQYDNLILGELDQEFVNMEILENAKLYALSNKNKKMAGVF